MINLVIDPLDPELVPLGVLPTGSKYRPLTVRVAPSRVVRLAAGGFLWEGAPVVESLTDTSGSVVITVPATDGTEILEADRNTFEYVVTVTAALVGHSRGRRTVEFRGMLPTSLGATVPVTSLVSSAPVPPQYVSAQALLNAIASGGSAVQEVSGVVTLDGTGNSVREFLCVAPATINGVTFDTGDVVVWLRSAGVWSYREVTGWAVPPAPPTPPVGGTLATSGVATNGFTMTVTGATDPESGLHPEPYRFSTNGGTSWSAWQASNIYAATGLTASTTYQPRAQVRNNNTTPDVATLTAANVTTSAPVAGVLTYQGYSSPAAQVFGDHTYEAPIGAASASRQVIVALTWGSGANRHPSLTINGSTPTQDYTSLSATRGLRVYRMTVPTGTTATIVSTEANGHFPAIAVWTVNAPVTFIAGANAESAAGVMSTTVGPMSAANAGFAISAFRTTSTTFSTTWSGITERYDSAAAQPAAGGDAVTTSTHTVTATYSAAPSIAVRLGVVTYGWTP